MFVHKKEKNRNHFSTKTSSKYQAKDICSAKLCVIFRIGWGEEFSMSLF